MIDCQYLKLLMNHFTYSLYYPLKSSVFHSSTKTTHVLNVQCLYVPIKLEWGVTRNW